MVKLLSMQNDLVVSAVQQRDDDLKSFRNANSVQCWRSETPSEQGIYSAAAESPAKDFHSCLTAELHAGMLLGHDNGHFPVVAKMLGKILAGE